MAKTPVLTLVQDAPQQSQSTTYASVILMMAMGGSAAQANAATDGESGRAGATSTGSVRISLTIPEQIDVAGLDRVELANEGGNKGRGGDVSGCVSGRGSGQYHLSAVGPDLEAYDLGFAANGGALQPLTMGQALRQLEGAGALGCADGTSNARLSVRFNNSRSAGSEGSPLMLMISPE